MRITTAKVVDDENSDELLFLLKPESERPPDHSVEIKRILSEIKIGG